MKKNKKTGFRVNVWYLASGYKNGMESTAMRNFYYLTDSISEAYKRALEDFRDYWMIQTRDPDSGYYKLNYEIEGINFEKRILD